MGLSVNVIAFLVSYNQHQCLLFGITSGFFYKVDPPGEEFGLSSLDSMLSGDSLSTMISNGDPQKALAMAGVFASVLNHIDSNASTTGNLTAEEQAKKSNESQRVDEVRNPRNIDLERSSFFD